MNRRRHRRQLIATVLAGLLGATAQPAAPEAPVIKERLIETLEIEPVWAGHSVGFALLTSPPDQFVAYYDAQRQMTVAHRRLDQSAWTLKKLPPHLGWDSHNGVVMAMDSTGHLHVCGNMHASPLVYFRTTAAGDVTSLERVPVMVSADLEQRVTYPHFMAGPAGALIFRYRLGSSGRGDDYYNRYDPTTRTWQALLNGPLLGGQGRMNGYFSMPAAGPDGRFHMVGVWRDTPDAATNHDPSYARSPDLVHWERADGRPIPVPMTLQTVDIVEAVPAGCGLINGNCRLGFDPRGRPVVTYHRYDAAGNTQIYGARFEETQWRVVQISDWDGYRWDFGGGGSIAFEVRVGAVRTDDDGRLLLDYGRPDQAGTWLLDPDSLRPIGPAPAPRLRRAGTGAVTSAFPGMRVRQAADSGGAGAPGVRYVLRWESLGPNRDRPREPPLPEPSMLTLLRLEAPVPP